MLLIEAIKDGSRATKDTTTLISSHEEDGIILQEIYEIHHETKVYMYVLECTDGTLPRL